MTELIPLPTHFAPAGRAPADSLQIWSRHFLDIPLLRQLFDAVPDIVLVLNQQRQIVFANKALLQATNAPNLDQVLGLRPGEVLGCLHALEMPDGCGTSEFCKTCGAVQAVLSSLAGLESVQECRIGQAGGQALDLRVWATPLDLNGDRFSLFAIKDVSHEMRRRALERLFFHDLLNLAGGLQGFAYLLKQAQPDEIETIRDAIFNLSSRLVEEIEAQRELAAAENNELVVHPVTIDSLELLEEVAETYRQHPVARERQLLLDSQAVPIIFTSDRTLLSRVIGNMTKNGLEACQPGETVTLSCTVTPAGQIEFSVHNPTHIPRLVELQIFRRSFSTKGPGRGLGTYSIKLLSERYLRGSVSFTTSAKKGTTFFARYPFVLAEP